MTFALCNTGLHTNYSLMEELIACKKAIGKVVPGAPNVSTPANSIFGSHVYFVTEIIKIYFMIFAGNPASAGWNNWFKHASSSKRIQ